MSEEIVNALLEGDDLVDPKSFSKRVPNVYDEAVQWAKDAFDKLWADGFIKSPRNADEKMSELASDACANFDLNENEDYEAVVTELYKYSAETVKGVW